MPFRIVVKPGSFGIGADRIDVKITGKQGHANTPHLANDALLAACQYVVALQQIVSRCIDPLKTETLNVGMIRSGEAPNIVSDTAVLSFNARAFDLESREITKRKIYDIAEGIEKITGCKFDIIYNDGYEPLVNDAAMADFVQNVCREEYGSDSVANDFFMTCDDFSYYMNATNTPGCYYWLEGGTETGEAFANHHPKFSFREEAMQMGTVLFIALTMKYLND
jgi:amidohydrolase